MDWNQNTYGLTIVDNVLQSATERMMIVGSKYGRLTERYALADEVSLV